MEIRSKKTRIPYSELTSELKRIMDFKYQRSTPILKLMMALYVVSVWVEKVHLDSEGELSYSYCVRFNKLNPLFWLSLIIGLVFSALKGFLIYAFEFLKSRDLWSVKKTNIQVLDR